VKEEKNPKHFGGYLRAKVLSNHEKTGHKKSNASVPLKNKRAPSGLLWNNNGKEMLIN